MDGLVSTNNIESAKRIVQDTAKVVITLSKQYKLVLIGTGTIVGLYWYVTRTHGFFKKLGIPGPEPGFFGAFGDYRKKGIRNFDREVMEKYGKVVGIFHATRPIYMVSDPDLIKQITVREFNNFVNRDTNSVPRDLVIKDSILFSYDEQWKFHRGIMSPAFTSGKMRSMCPLVQKCVDNLLKNLWKTSEEGKKSLKMKDMFSMFGIDVVASVAFGLELDCQSDPDNPFLRQSQQMLNLGLKFWTYFTICAIFPFMVKVFEALGVRTFNTDAGDFFFKVVSDTIQHRLETNITRNDFLTLMLNSNKLEEERQDQEEERESYLEFKFENRGMKIGEIAGNAFVFLLAGLATTSITLSFMAYNLATNPNWQEKVTEEIDRILKGAAPDYDNVSRLQSLENVLLETLRMYPPAVRITRNTKEDIEIGGRFFKKGVDVTFPLAAIHYDPDVWQDPDTFDPNRFLPENRPNNFNYVFIPFGVGPRNCVGMRLAQMEIKIAMAAILQKYRFKPAPETKIPPDLEKRVFRPKDGMVLMIEKR